MRVIMAILFLWLQGGKLTRRVLGRGCWAVEGWGSKEARTVEEAAEAGWAWEEALMVEEVAG